MNDDKIEELLHKAPAPRAPADLLERLEASIELPGHRPAHGRDHGSRIRYWFPALSLAASAAALAILAVVFLSPAPVAYSFGKTVEALRNTQSVHIMHKFRVGPQHSIVVPGGSGTTNQHPANPFATAETFRKVANGREMSYTRGNNRELIRNGPLALKIDSLTGERDFYLSGSRVSAASYLDPADWFVELEEQAERGEIEYEVTDKVDSAGNVQIRVRHYGLGVNEFMRFWVNGQSFLPVRFQVVSTGFPEFGAEVVMMEFELIDFGGDLDDALFAIEPTNAELEKFGLTRKELADLAPGTTSIEITGEVGLRVVGSISDGNEKRQFAETLPLMLIEAPEGNLYIDLRTEDGESRIFTIKVGGGESMMGAERIGIFLGKDGTNGVMGIPTDVEDLEAFIDRRQKLRTKE